MIITRSEALPETLAKFVALSVHKKSKVIIDKQKLGRILPSLQGARRYSFDDDLRGAVKKIGMIPRDERLALLDGRHLPHSRLWLEGPTFLPSQHHGGDRDFESLRVGMLATIDRQNDSFNFMLIREARHILASTHITQARIFSGADERDLPYMAGEILLTAEPEHYVNATPEGLVWNQTLLKSSKEYYDALAARNSDIAVRHFASVVDDQTAAADFFTGLLLIVTDDRFANNLAQPVDQGSKTGTAGRGAVKFGMQGRPPLPVTPLAVEFPPEFSHILAARRPDADAMLGFLRAGANAAGNRPSAAILPMPTVQKSFQLQ